MSQFSLIASSVGIGGANDPADTLLIQKCLNAIPAKQGGPMPILKPDSIVGPATIGAIGRFQTHNLNFRDGLIDPGQQTEQMLVKLLSLLGLLIKLLQERPGIGPPPTVPMPHPRRPVPPARPTAGEITPIRQFFLDTMNEWLPADGSSTNGAAPSGVSKTATGCGGFPGRIFRKRGVPKGYGPSPNGPGDFVVKNLIDEKGRTLQPFERISGYGIGWEYMARAVSRDYPADPCWIPFVIAGARPKPGDIYIQKYTHGPFVGKHSHLTTGMFAHVGVVISLTGETFVTGDGGQPPNGFSSRRNTRKLFADGTCETPDSDPGRRLAGWMDLDVIWAAYQSSTS